MSSTTSNWLDASSTSNLSIQTYIQGFLDISGGNVMLRNNNFYVKTGDVSLGGRLFVARDLSINGNLYIGANTIAANAIIGGAGTGGVYWTASGSQWTSSNNISRVSIILDTSAVNTIDLSGTISVSNAIGVGVTNPQFHVDVGAGGIGCARYVQWGAGSAPTHNVTTNIIAGTFNSTLTTTADTSLNGRLFVGADSSLNGNLVVGKVVTTASLVSAGATFSGAVYGTTVATTGTVTAAGLVAANAGLTVATGATFTGPIYGTGATFSGAITTGGALTVTADSSLNGNLTLGGNLVVNGELTVKEFTQSSIINTITTNVFNVSEDLSLNGRFFASGDASLNGRLYVRGNTTLTNGLSVSAGTVSFPAATVSTAALTGTLATIGSTAISAGVTTTTLAGLTLTSPTLTGTSILTSNTAYNNVKLYVSSPPNIGVYFNYPNSIGNAYYDGTNWNLTTDGSNRCFSNMVYGYSGMNFITGIIGGTTPAAISDATMQPFIRMSILNSGNVGIGTTNPQSALHIVGGTASTNFTGLTITSNANTATTRGQQLLFNLDAGSGSYYNQGMISTYREDNVANFNSSLLFSSTVNGVLNERMRINSSGNVGIGTTNPGATLHLTSATPQLLMFPSGTALGQTSAILFAGTFGSSSGTADTGARYTSQIVSGFKPTATWGGEYLAFNVGYGGSGNDAKAFDIERMRIDGYGNVGIGTTNPTKMLTVAGDALINGLTVGKGAGSVSTNTAVGASALNANTATGLYNTAVGFSSLQSNTTGSTNTSFGINALNLNTVSNNNTAVGGSALQNTTGANNTAIGASAGNTGTANTIGSNNTYLGYNTGSNANNYSNSTAIGSNATITASNQIVLGTAAEKVYMPGNVGIGTTNPSYPLHITVTGPSAGGSGGFQNSAAAGAVSGWGLSNMQIFLTGSMRIGDAIGYASDNRIKKNIQDIDGLHAISKLMQIKPRTYNYIDTIGKGNAPIYGFVAQDVEKVLPYNVKHGDDFIPNIYELADVNANTNIVTLRTKSTNEFTFDPSGTPIEIKGYDASDNETTYKIKRIIDDKSFEVDCVVEEPMVFIYGQKIKDFKTINKDDIYTLTTAAVKFLIPMVETLQSENAELKAKFATLAARLSAAGF
jgi:hypothetical protein